MQMKYNYHTHTYRCLHALGTDEDYVKAAISAGITELGFSDHMPWPKVKGESQHIRMNVKWLDDYVKSIRKLQDKYKDKITIYIGFEAEYYKDRMNWLYEVKEKYDIDYFILGNHFYVKENWDTYFGSFSDKENLCKYYYETSEEALRTGLYSYFAHPDIFLNGEEVSGEFEEAAYKICKLCKELDIPLEYNLEGKRSKRPLKYPRNEFWEIASKVGNRVIIGGDFHSPFTLKKNEYYNSSYEYLKSLGLEIVEKLNLGLDK